MVIALEESNIMLGLEITLPWLKVYWREDIGGLCHNKDRNVLLFGLKLKLIKYLQNKEKLRKASLFIKMWKCKNKFNKKIQKDLLKMIYQFQWEGINIQQINRIITRFSTILINQYIRNIGKNIRIKNKGPLLLKLKNCKKFSQMLSINRI